MISVLEYSKPSILLISRLPLHGAYLHKSLSKHYDVVWIGQTFPFKITTLNVSYLLFREFCAMLVNFKRLRFSLIVIQFVSLDGIVAVLFKRIFRTKIVLFAVGSDILRIREHASAYPIIKFIIAESDFVFCTSGFIQKKLKTMDFSASKMKVIPSVVDFDDFEAYHGPKIFDIVNVGALDSNKNQMLLIKACESLPSVKVLIVGDGPLRGVLESESVKRHLDLVFLGEIPRKQVFRELQKSRIYVHTSKNEGLPVAVLEAMFLSLPVILVERPYVYDIEHRYGFKVHVVRDNSIEDLANTLREVLQNYEIEHRRATTNKHKIQDLISESSNEIRERLDKFVVT